MGQFFDSRRFLRTPPFVNENMYGDMQQVPQSDFDMSGIGQLPSRRMSEDDHGFMGDNPPLPPRNTMPDDNGIVEGQPLPSRKPIDWMERIENLPPRNTMPDDNGIVEGQPLPSRKPIDWMERIENLPPRPLPSQPSRMRGAMAGFLGAYNPEAGEDIRHPGYKDDVRKWEAEQERMAAQLKMTQGMSQVQANEARRRAEEARALREGATRERTYGQMASDGIRNVNPGDTVGQYRDGSFNPLYTAPSLPPKPETPGMRITREEAQRIGLYVEGDAQYVEIPNQGSAAYLNRLPRADKSYDTLKQSIRDAHPDWEQPYIDAEAAKLFREKVERENALKSAQTTRALRPPVGRSGGLTPNQENTQVQRKVNQIADIQVGEAGSVDAAIANLEAWPPEKKDEMHAKTLAELKARKGRVKPSGSGRWGGGKTTPKTPASPAALAPPKPSDTKDPLGIR